MLITLWVDAPTSVYTSIIRPSAPPLFVRLPLHYSSVCPTIILLMQTTNYTLLCTAQTDITESGIKVISLRRLLEAIVQGMNELLAEVQMV